MTAHDVFHEGERAVQARAGEQAAARRNGRAISEVIAPGALQFLADQRVIAIASESAEGIWGSLWFGRPGFIRPESGSVVTVALSGELTSEADPVFAAMRPGGELGMLVIDLDSRRRLRVNGTVHSLSREAVVVAVRETFPNCPKYVQRRRIVETIERRRAEPAASGAALDGPRRALAERTDTVFVASRHPERGLDMSHRGGEPGFVRVLDDRTLRVPDYAGNSMFQTFGNITVDPRVGAVLTDFERGRLVSLTGRARVIHEAEDRGQPTGGTGRYWELEVDRWQDIAMPTAYRWDLVERSRFNPPARAVSG